jgi:hypothetical protein
LKKIAILTGLTLVLAGCFSPWQGDKGTVTVSIGSPAGNGRAADTVPWGAGHKINELTHTITFSGGPGHEQKREVTGTQAVTFSVYPGRWNISVEACAGNNKIAVGSAIGVEIKPGPNEPVFIEMKQPKSSQGTYTVVYVANGGSGTMESSSFTPRSEPQSLPLNTFTHPAGHVFAGWATSPDGQVEYTDGQNVIDLPADEDGVVTLYAVWISSTSLAGQLALLKNAQNNTVHTITVSEDESIPPTTLYYSGKNVNITIKALESIGSTGGGECTISLSSNGSMFTVGSGVTLILDNNITLQGKDGNNTHLVLVSSGGSLEMRTGSRITGNTNTSGTNGGGVLVNGTFTMNGGEISSNEAVYRGGGVYVYTEGTFIMEGGEIYDNSSTEDSGGGVAVYEGIFTMNGGKIRNNFSSFRGGGVYVQSGTFTMNRGEISNNTTTGSGGGVHLNSKTIFTMKGGKIYGNEAGTGGGVHVNDEGTFFTMTGGEIYSNKAGTYGGGVRVDGTFTMDGGEIYGNEASTGGGVYVNSGSFQIVNGTIYGSNEAAGVRNTATTGAALYNSSSGKAQYGTFSDDGITWDGTDLIPTGNTYNDTIEVMDGNLQ